MKTNKIFKAKRDSGFSKISLSLALSTTLILSTGSGLIGCSSLSDRSANPNSFAWLNSGELTFGGAVPTAKQKSPSLSKRTDYNQYAYGFSPTAPAGSKSLILDTSRKTAKLMQAGKEIARAKLLDSSGMTPGEYQVAHKQRNPLWYAPQDYFSSRGISVPVEGDKRRYLRGAFGDFALFVSPSEAIHSGPFSLSELNGARVEEQDFAKIFYLVEVGDSIRIE